MYRLLATALAAGLLVPAAASAATLEVVSGTGQRALTVSLNQPVGQTFTALEGALTSFGFRINVLNPGTVGGSLTLRLLSGIGSGGTEVGSATLTPVGIPADRTPGWADFAFSGLSLAAGQSYTALLTATTNRYALTYGPDINIFTGAALGGDAYANGALLGANPNDRTCASGICDASFRLTTQEAAAVPEPAGWALMIGGLGVVGVSLRRRVRVAIA